LGFVKIAMPGSSSRMPSAQQHAARPDAQQPFTLLWS
jgi:hypothetical protein